MTKQREKELLKRIDDLERKVKELEARPATQIHYHYAQPYPYYMPTYVPAPQPWYPHPIWSTTAGAIGHAGGVGSASSSYVSYDPTIPSTPTAGYAVNG